ncbi:ABC transporter permease [Sulfurimonas sp. SAG-AH-194-L11]|nr:ABC transporter permease [Sulfurimonas sp. SAG-AH-194-L11]MDF1876953.1 ABC transporter permease [Sulfurimonas sp. SAG-AH-194-L11]
MNIVKAIAKKEFMQLKSEPRLIGFLIFMPLMMLLLFGYALKLEPKDVKMAYVDADKSYFSNLIKTNIWSEGYFKLYEVNSTTQIIEEIRSGRAHAGMYIAKDFSRKLTDNAQPTVHFYVDGTMPSLATSMKNNSDAINGSSVTNDMYFLDEDAANVVIAQDPFVLDTEVLFNKDEKETWFFLPAVIGVLIMQISLILAGISMVREKEANTLEQLLVAPISKTQLIVAKILPYTLIGFFEFFFILFLGYFLFELPVPASAAVGLLLLSVVYVGSMIAMGLFISIISQTQQQAMFIAIFIIIPSILLSGMIFPIEAMPQFIRPVAYLFPLTYFNEIIRGLLIKETLFVDLLFDYLVLFGFSIFFCIVSILKFRKYIV